MMPDRYEEIKKRAMLGAPIVEEGKISFTEPLEVEGDVVKAPTQFMNATEENIPQFDSPETVTTEPDPKSYMDGTSAMYLGDLAASAGPSLLALLGGASPAVMSGLLDKGNAYAMNRGKQEEITKDKISVIDEGGEPLNILTRDSVGKKPYYQTKIGSLSNLAGVVNGIPQKMYNPTTGERAVVQQYKDGTAYRYGTKEIIPDIQFWQQDMGVGSATGTDPYGTKTTDQYDKNKPSKIQTVKTTGGYGAMIGAPIQTIKDTNKITEKYAKDTDILETKRNELSSAINIFKNEKASPTELTAAREALIRSVTAETRLTDEDVQRALGNDFRPLLNQVGSSLSNKAFGEMSNAQKADFLQGAETLRRRLENGLNFIYNKSKQRASAMPGGKKYFESQTPKRTQSAKIKEADDIKNESIAAKKYGRGTPMYNKFMEFYNIKMGQ